MNRPSLNLGDLVEHWTLVGAEQDLVASKHRDTQVGFALMLKSYGRFGRFPRGRAELHPDTVEFVAKQLGWMLACSAVHHEAAPPVRVPLQGSQCGVGNGRMIAWTAHDDEFSSRDRSLAVAEQPAEGRRARCQAQW